MESKKVLAAIVAGLLFAATVCFVVIICYEQGYNQGIAYQKTQPVMLHIDDVRGTNVINTHEIALSEKGSISMGTGGRFVQENNITQYWITLSKN
jgi:hypothetical protein